MNIIPSYFLAHWILKANPKSKTTFKKTHMGEIFLNQITMETVSHSHFFS